MTEFKLTIADPKTGKCIQKTAEGDSTKGLIGLKIGGTVKGELIDLTGYEFEITGGSDYCGFPMRKGIQGARKRILIGKSVGFSGSGKGIRRRKTVCGETINDKVTQINLKITKAGKADIFAKAEAPAEDKKSDSAPETPKAEETPKEKKEE